MTSNDLNVSYPTGFSFSITGIVGSPTASAISIASKINALSNGISATSSVATVTLTASGSLFGGSLNGLTPSVTGQAASKVTLGLFGGGSDGSTTASATSIATKINALSNGLVATATASTVQITGSASLFGASLNGLTATVTGAASTKVTLVNFTGGSDGSTTASATSIATKINALSNGILATATASTVLLTATNSVFGSDLNNSTPVVTGSASTKVTLGNFNGGLVKQSTIVLSAPSSTLDRIVGAKINGVTPVETGTGASKLTAGPWTGGVSPFTTVWKYHIDEYFRLGKGQLWIGVFPVPNNFDFNEIVTVQNAALGQIRQIGIFKSGDDMTTYSATDTTAIQAKCNTLSTARRPLVVILQPNIKLVTDFNSLPNLNQYSNTNVSVVIGQDGANAGKKLYDIYGYTVGMLGATLGCLSTFRVSESIGWVAKQLSLPFSTAEYDTAAFGNGVEYKTLNSTDLDLLADKNYTFIRKFEGLAGSFISDSKTAVSNTSDFFSLERNRTIDKARRLTYTALVPFVNSPLEVDSTGKLSALTIAIFTQTINTQLTTMTSAGELSGFQVVIDPNQNVTATDTININLFLQPIGVARFVEVKVSFTVAAVTTT